MLTTVDFKLTRGTYISFRLQPCGIMGTRKTEIWDVVPENSEEPIAHVKWFGRWRKYCFFPLADSVYEETCLREIAEFCEARTKEHKGKAL